ncbi:hypothetical protein BDW72DRAFT_188411 [Aspergillus terricola var. indicus]
MLISLLVLLPMITKLLRSQGWPFSHGVTIADSPWTYNSNGQHSIQTSFSQWLSWGTVQVPSRLRPGESRG